MNKLVFGVGVNDLDYRTHVYEHVTKDGGERVLKPVFRCKYHTAWENMLQRCYIKKEVLAVFGAEGIPDYTVDSSTKAQQNVPIQQQKQA